MRPTSASRYRTSRPVAHGARNPPEVFSQVQPGERIWFDDGRIGGVVKTVSPDGWVVEITQARDGGERLASDKGINLPDSLLDLPALTPKDVDDLAVAARLADMVGLSFVQRAQDVEELRNRLKPHWGPGTWASC